MVLEGDGTRVGVAPEEHESSESGHCVVDAGWRAVEHALGFEREGVDTLELYARKDRGGWNERIERSRRWNGKWRKLKCG